MLSIAIDGPAAAGKTTQAKILAKKLGFTYVDTGAMYRALAVAVKDNGSASIEEVLSVVRISIRNIDGEQHMFVNEDDVTSRLRTPEISMLASTISQKPEVRDFLLALQRDMAKTANVVMEGRDIGTVILPEATVKVYLTAQLQIRAMRRYRDLYHEASGIIDNQKLCGLREAMHARDVQDMSRAVAPLKKADDAVELDNTRLSIDGTTEAILQICRERGLDFELL